MTCDSVVNCTINLFFHRQGNCDVRPWIRLGFERRFERNLWKKYETHLKLWKLAMFISTDVISWTDIEHCRREKMNPPIRSKRVLLSQLIIQLLQNCAQNTTIWMRLVHDTTSLNDSEIGHGQTRFSRYFGYLIEAEWRIYASVN